MTAFREPREWCVDSVPLVSEFACDEEIYGSSPSARSEHHRQEWQHPFDRWRGEAARKAT
jgi:hypothetical protein